MVLLRSDPGTGKSEAFAHVVAKRVARKLTRFYDKTTGLSVDASPVDLSRGIVLVSDALNQMLAGFSWPGYQSIEIDFRNGAPPVNLRFRLDADGHPKPRDPIRLVRQPPFEMSLVGPGRRGAATA
ncbi:hypothetical protein O7605_31750 [Verrucosispora sp. WMMA2121]|uniref:hypothetical protein n=1 Tax=Verrucosispora sp. WMMA2121 TaxID=3015164 RepID=UPI0022B5EB0D|nr:hypothetical protein [Verrucosispora sp. WMMA2121]MCZ7423784.1 hypothetical protein [Verrucosispora sp. WMMA2121]MCZ7424074.1 hypothetical protein [Verrucosispora sp. WMMA2121]MCZ7424089.1 hypothetical protein [Verrucosispora sp. WMMA2121]